MYIVGKIADKTLVEVSGIYGQTNPNPTIILANVIKRVGGIAKDYFVFYICDKSEQAERILDGDTFDAIWIKDEITSVVFAKEDIKKWLRVVVDKTIVTKDGIDKVIQKFQILEADKSKVDITFNDTILIPIHTPTFAMNLKVTFIKGECLRDLKFDQYGKYVYPRKMKHYLNLRVEDSKEIESVMEVS